jgi:tryptophan synthase alpha chain
MSTITEVFAECRQAKRSAFIPFLTAGDPDLETTGQLLQALVVGGADIIELGVPFSDPIADGPTIQRSSRRALEGGIHLSDILRLVARHRDRLGVPIVLFTYYNPIHARGVESFAEQAASSGVDGVLCVDLPPDEADDFIAALDRHGLDTIFLLAPTSTKDRVQKVVESSSGFVYYVSRTGVTGARQELPKELLKECKRLRRRTGELPLAVGFGISTPRQVAQVAKVADGVVVGSALVQLVEEKTGDPDLVAAVERKVRELTAPLHGR